MVCAAVGGCAREPGFCDDNAKRGHLVLDLGPGKTGTTARQNFLHNNFEWVSDAHAVTVVPGGIAADVTWSPGTKWARHPQSVVTVSTLVHLAKLNGSKEAMPRTHGTGGRIGLVDMDTADSVLGVLKQRLAAGETVLWSAEILEKNPVWSAKVVQRLAALAGRTTLVMTHRSTATKLRSSWAQYSKPYNGHPNGPPSFAEFLVSVLPDEGGDSAPGANPLQNELLSRMERVAAAAPNINVLSASYEFLRTSEGGAEGFLICNASRGLVGAAWAACRSSVAAKLKSATKAVFSNPSPLPAAIDTVRLAHMAATLLGCSRPSHLSIEDDAVSRVAKTLPTTCSSAGSGQSGEKTSTTFLDSLSALESKTWYSRSGAVLPASNEQLKPAKICLVKESSLTRSHWERIAKLLEGCPASATASQHRTDKEHKVGIEAGGGPVGPIQIVHARNGGCFDNDNGKANRINLGDAPSAIACASKVLANLQCSLYFEFDLKEKSKKTTTKDEFTLGFCGCGGSGGNECQGVESNTHTSSIYHITSFDSTRVRRGEKGVQLQQYRSGMTFASNRNFESTFESAALELNRWAASHGDAKKKELKEKMGSIAISYIMTKSGGTGGHYLDLGGTPDRITAIGKVLPKKMTNEIDDKRTFNLLAREAGVEGSVVPRMFETTAEAISVLEADPAASKIVFIKTVGGANADGIFVERTDNLTNVKLGPHQIIQEGVTRPALDHGRTMKFRAYAVAYGGRLYASKNFAWPKCSPSLQLAANVDGDLASRYISQHWPQSGEFVVDARRREEWAAAFVVAASSMAPMFKKLVAATAKDPNQRVFQYHIFGLDAIPREDGSVQIVEVNPFPNLDRFATDSLGRPRTGDSTEDQITAVTTLLKLLYGMYTDDLVDVSSVPS